MELSGRQLGAGSVLVITLDGLSLPVGPPFTDEVSQFRRKVADVLASAMEWQHCKELPL